MDRAKPLERMRGIQATHHEGVPVPDFPRIEKVVKALRRQRPGRLLDIGYSSGSFADYLADEGWRCVGLDLNRPPSPKIPVLQCDLNEGIPLGSGSVDLVTAGEVIEHLFNEEAFLRECRRVLKPGGRLVLTTPNLAFLPSRFLMLIGRPPLFVTAPYHYHFYTLRMITDRLREAGFRVEKATSSHLLYSRRRHWSGRVFERLGDAFPTLGAHLILFARKPER